jgi:hypothetical protein
MGGGLHKMLDNSAQFPSTSFGEKQSENFKMSANLGRAVA